MLEQRKAGFCSVLRDGKRGLKGKEKGEDRVANLVYCLKFI